MNDPDDNNEDEQNHPFSRLTQDAVIDAVESTGRISDLRVFPLNSYENRVYQVGIEDGEPLIAKFYRPDRWRREQIMEEHSFTLELSAADIPVIPPIIDGAGNSLHEHDGFLFSLCRRQGGHAPALDDLDNLYQLGQLFGRIHRVGAAKPFAERPALTVEEFGDDSVELILRDWMPRELRPAYESLAMDLLQRIKLRWAETDPGLIRTHGDGHIGNILYRDNRIWLVDLDDCRSAPAVQDLWMFLSGERDQQIKSISELVEGYNEFHDFSTRELNIVEALRTLRIMQHSAWLARRWSDPAFPRAFTWFNTPRYWSEHILALREQMPLLEAPPLTLY